MSSFCKSSLCMRSARGNVLFMILIGVALFAALGYAVSQSTRGTANLSNEQNELGATRAIDFMNNAQLAFDSLSITYRVAPENIRYNNDIYQRRSGALLNTAMGSPADPKLYFFHPSGGGVKPVLFTDIATPCSGCDSANAKDGHVVVRWTNTVSGLGTTTEDMAIRIDYVSDAVCKAVNKKFGISGIPTINGMSYTVPTPGTPAIVGSFATGPGAAAISGKRDFCIFNNGGTGAGNQYYHILKLN